MAAPYAHADPLKLDEDITDTMVIPYDDSDPAAGTFTFSYRYPRVDSAEADADIVNGYYRDQIEMNETNMYFFADGYAAMGTSVTKDISYRITCNNDDYLSALMMQDLQIGDSHRIIWEGNTFSRKNGGISNTSNLPKLLGLLDTSEQDEFKIEKQARKVSEAVLEIILDMIDENPDRIPYYYDLITYDYLLETVYPEEDFYLNENGDFVFFVNPGVIADESLGYMLFPIPFDDVADAV